ncbi:MAG: hypothetical protein GPJ54_22065 [Candidatus Heimdallarchaeota archaeon]|nr:hypothetical protein [Candidatus Heimdallarchaeota archaeon]
MESVIIIKSYRFIAYIFMLTLFVTSQSSGGNDPLNVLIDETTNDYHIEIITSQWEMLAIDLVRVEKLMGDGMSETKARETASYNGSIGFFLTGKTIRFAITSTDVQHGFQLGYKNAEGDEISIAVAANRPLPGEDYGTYINAQIDLPDRPMTIKANCYIFCGLGHPNMNLEFVVKDESNTLTLDAEGLQFVVGSLVLITGLSISVYKIRPLIFGRPLILSDKQEDIISKIFKSQTSIYFYVMGRAKEGGGFDTNDIPLTIPKDIYNYKFLLHPIRLSMAKLLYENMQMTSIELKTMLEVSTNDINTHINALQKKGYIHTEHKFVEGSRKLIVTLKPFGSEQFKILIDLLHLFLDNSSNYDELLQSNEFSDDN